MAVAGSSRGRGSLQAGGGASAAQGRRRTAPASPGSRRNSSTRPPQSGPHLAVVSRIGARCALAASASPTRAALRRKWAMLMSVVEGARWAPAYPELAGKRVLVTGLSSSCGVDVARAFADHKVRLILQFDEMSDETQAIAEIAAPVALDIRAFGPVTPEAREVAQFARNVMQAFGGLDAVINLMTLAPADVGTATSLDEIERRVAERLLLPCLIAKIAANR